MPQLLFRPKYVWFPIHLKGPMIPDPSGQLSELIVYITSTRVDLYSHQILLTSIRGPLPSETCVSEKAMPLDSVI